MTRQQFERHLQAKKAADRAREKAAANAQERQTEQEARLGRRTINMLIKSTPLLALLASGDIPLRWMGLVKENADGIFTLACTSKTKCGEVLQFKAASPGAADVVVALSSALKEYRWTMSDLKPACPHCTARTALQNPAAAAGGGFVLLKVIGMSPEELTTMLKTRTNEIREAFPAAFASAADKPAPAADDTAAATDKPAAP